MTDNDRERRGSGEQANYRTVCAGWSGRGGFSFGLLKISNNLRNSENCSPGMFRVPAS